MFVLTIDQVASRRTADRIPELLAMLQDVPTLLPFERTVGDEAQGVPISAIAAAEAIRRVLRSGGWHIGIGCAPDAQENLPTSVREGSGMAFVCAREAVEASKRLPVSLAVRVPTVSNGEGTTADEVHAASAAKRGVRTAARGRSAAAGSAVEVNPLRGEALDRPARAAELQALLHVIGIVVQSRTVAQREAVQLLESGETGQAIARALSITPQAVSQRRLGAHWAEEQAVWPLAVRLLHELDSGGSSKRAGEV
ncbi:hypothetical protein [Actinobaculum sp. 313]|uniref:hypothetical protein n=1 Tax=Actinobaculum sp. 313 TaxID=2495645 RepID=UPI000D5283A7|nr:hypothetical protein [Actinobaculum sp. 313]AWE43010.1 hypothetical protein DDD63_09975 [Actinobaculum sp. 313]